jgi:hypothetical protein
MLAIASASSLAQNSAVRFIDSQPVPVSNFCFNSFPQLGASGQYAALAGHFHAGSPMDLMVICAPTFPPGTPPSNTAMLNQGNGTFTPVEDSAIQYEATPVHIADLNGDHFDDLILSTVNADNFGVQISNGNGTFKAPVYYAPSPSNSEGSLTSIVSGDFNGDGKPDVAVVDSVPTTGANNTQEFLNTLSIFLNDGSGVMKQAASYPLTITPISELLPIVVAGDLNGDSESDLAVIYRGASPTVTPFFATGAGAFRKGGSYSTGSTLTPESAVIGKFTGSGYGDIAITTTSRIEMLLGSSSGTFTVGPSTNYPYPLSGFSGGSLAVPVDYDKDGKLDLAVGVPGFVLVFWGAGNGSLTGPTSFSQSTFLRSMVAADMQGDGFADLVVTGIDSSVNLLFNQGGRQFFAASNTPSAYATGIVVRDFNADGKKDIAVVNTPPCKAPCSGTVTVFPGSGANYFNPGKSYSIGMHGSAIAVGDVNGDGIDDLVVTNATPGDNADTSVLLGIKGGTFHAARNFTLGSLSNVAYLVDMNRDGKLDLVEAGGVALGKGDGTFGPLMPFPEGISFGILPNGGFSTFLGVGDFNNDGIHDVVALYTAPDGSSQRIWELLGDGKGNFTATPIEDTNGLLETQYVGVVVGKLHGGSIDDIAVASNGAHESGEDGLAVVFLGDGKGNFHELESGGLTDGGNVGAITIADFNHDGINDIGFASSDQFLVWLGQGNGTFPSPYLQMSFIGTGTTTNQSGNLAVADFNGDGWPDVVATNAYGISRLYGVPVPVVSPSSLSFTSNTTKSVTIHNNLATAQTVSAALTSDASPAYKIVVNSCKGSLAAGATCTVSLQYVSPGQPTFNKLYVSAKGVFIAYLALSGN